MGYFMQKIIIDKYMTLIIIADDTHVNVLDLHLARFELEEKKCIYGNILYFHDFIALI
jgi:hypothetical protein